MLLESIPSSKQPHSTHFSAFPVKHCTGFNLLQYHRLKYQKAQLHFFQSKLFVNRIFFLEDEFTADKDV